MTIQPEEFQQETRRLQDVREKIRRRIGGLRETVEVSYSDVAATRRNFWNDISVNVENEDDLIETAASIAQQANVLTVQERSYRIAEDALRKLERIVDAPYFSRIDFTEEGESRAERIYIGISSFIDSSNDEILIYDWRAPISSLFYDYPPGPAEYQTPEMQVRGELSLKRQYIIKNGVMADMFDTGISIGDDMLQQMLGRSADEKMRSIVTTIQREQNLIIRDDKNQTLIVQGAAGSGKTSVALQRVAYLLYKYRNTLSADNMLLFSPNSLFSDYVSNVLPELGEANMRQTTFKEHLAFRLGYEGMRVEDAYDQLEYILNGEEEGASFHARMAGIRYKASAAFLQVIEAYGELLKQEEIWFKPFAVGEKVLIPADVIGARFYEKPSILPLSSRVENLTDWISERLSQLETDIGKRIYRKMVRDPKYLGTEQEMKRMGRRKAHKAIAPLVEKAKALDYIDVLGMYRRLFEEQGLFARLSQAAGTPIPEGWKEICAYTLDKLKRGEVSYEDATPLAYLKGLIQGQPAARMIRYVIVDEAQDYSPFQFAYLRKLFPRARFTLLGDWNQGIFSHAEKAGGYSSIGELLNEDTVETIQLVKSYRSTREIMEFAQAILPYGEPLEPFSRSGEKPWIEQAGSRQELHRKICDSIKEMTAEGAQSIAVICRTERETLHAFEHLWQHIPQLRLITKDTQHFASGVWILPAYLAKGLEFDAVLLYETGQNSYAKERERKLLYTACTRALHRLHIFYTGERMNPFLLASADVAGIR